MKSGLYFFLSQSLFRKFLKIFSNFEEFLENDFKKMYIFLAAKCNFRNFFETIVSNSQKYECLLSENFGPGTHCIGSYYEVARIAL